MKGKQTLGENIADNGGLKSSFYAYNELTKETSIDEPLLPGLNFSHKQLFFIAFAQVGTILYLERLISLEWFIMFALMQNQNNFVITIIIVPSSLLL